MATIPSNTRFIGISPRVSLKERRSKSINSETQPYTMQDIVDTARPYKVYTALLTQRGGDSPTGIVSGPVTKGVTYHISGIDGDFSNVGAPNNNSGTFFVAINDEVPNSYGTSNLKFNEGAPVVTVLENTIGNIWFTYNNTGEYYCRSNDLFITDKTAVFGGYYYASTEINAYYDSPSMSTSEFLIITGDPNAANGYLQNTPIEIRVYN